LAQKLFWLQDRRPSFSRRQILHEDTDAHANIDHLQKLTYFHYLENSRWRAATILTCYIAISRRKIVKFVFEYY